MALQLRTVPESQEFIDDTSLPGWLVSVRMGRNTRGAWVISRLAISPKARTLRQALHLDVPAGGITARLLRDLSLTDLHRHAARVLDADNYDAPPKPLKQKRGGPGRPAQYSRRWYERLAAEYLRLAAQGTPDVAKHLARTFRRADGGLLTHSAMRSAIRRARKMNLLGPTRQGAVSAAPPGRVSAVVR